MEWNEIQDISYWQFGSSKERSSMCVCVFVFRPPTVLGIPVDLLLAFVHWQQEPQQLQERSHHRDEAIKRSYKKTI